MKIYIASKAKHADMWSKLRDIGFDIIPACCDRNKDRTHTLVQYKQDMSDADVIILYVEKDETLRDIFIEGSIALTAGKPVCLVIDDEYSNDNGNIEDNIRNNIDMFHMFRGHTDFKEFNDINEALVSICRPAPTQDRP